MANKTAAFFRVEGTIVDSGVLSSAAYLAANAQAFGERLIRLSSVGVAAGFYGLMGQSDRTMANRVAHIAFRNMSEDRVDVIGAEYFEDVLKDKILDQGRDLIKVARSAGHEIVLLTENISHIMEPLVSHLKGVDHLVSNRLEFKNNKCTGRLLEPVIGGTGTRKWVMDFAAERGLDLSRSVAYAAHGSDALLLAAVGKPCAVNPDYTLRRTAEEADWPVVEYSA